MTDLMDGIKDKIAEEKIKKGGDTGNVSKLLNWLASHMLIMILVFLVVDKQFIPIVILLLFCLTRYAFFAGLLVIAYFIYLQYWTGVTFVSIWCVLCFLSNIIGHRFIKNNLFNGRTNINPFEGMKDMSILYFFHLGLFGFALYTKGIVSIIIWVVYFIVTLYIIARIRIRLKSNWCSIYYPLTIRYAHFLGLEINASQREGRIPLIENAVKALLKNVYSNLSEAETENFMQTIKKKLIEFSDRNDLIVYCMELYKNYDEKVYNNTFDKIHTSLINESDRQLPFFLYAEIIERDFGKTERLKFMIEVFDGKAN